MSLSLADNLFPFFRSVITALSDAADGGIEVGETFARENLCESFVNLLCDAVVLRK